MSNLLINLEIEIVWKNFLRTFDFSPQKICRALQLNQHCSKEACRYSKQFC